MYPYIIQGQNLVVVIDSKSHTINKTHLAYDKVVAAIKAADWETVKDLIEPVKVVLNYGSGNVTITGNDLFWRGRVMNNSLSRRMISMLEEGFPIEPMVAFMENLMSNPSNRAVTELYGFLENCILPITPDGHFLAYKKVRADYKDVHSGTFDNSVGQICEMERNMVNDDKNQTCSAGLHFCSQSYLDSFGGSHTMILKINPRDVVSIPSDYNDAKGRTCRYEVIGELNVVPEKAFTSSVHTNSTDNTKSPWPFPTKNDVKLGSSPFYQGYSDGYAGQDFDSGNLYGKDRMSYNEGFDKGNNDLNDGKAARYALMPVHDDKSSW
jgi:hypothetical protein